MIFAVVTSSCSKDEPNEVATSSSANSGDLVSINAYTGTTRAEDTSTSTLETRAYVEIHIDDSDAIQDTYEFTYSGTDWSQTDSSPVSWSDIEYPANFYSMFDGEPLTSLSFTEDVATSTNYTVTGSSFGHKDLVYHASSLSAMPSGGAVNIYHRHALSKIHLYAATGTTNVYIARVNLVSIDGEGTATITPLAADATSVTDGIEWTNSESNYQDYQYYWLDDDDEDGIPNALNSTTNGSNPIINDSISAPMMIIPQTTISATIESKTDDLATFTGSYVEVIYYMTDSEDMPVVGYPLVSSLPNASSYITDDQEKVLYVMAAFPLGYTFEANKEYDITLGLGEVGSSGGILVADYYVNADGSAVTLTTVGNDSDGDGDVDEDDGEQVEIPTLEVGDDILASTSEYIDIIVCAYDWDSGDAVAILNSDNYYE